MQIYPFVSFIAGDRNTLAAEEQEASEGRLLPPAPHGVVPHRRVLQDGPERKGADQIPLAPVGRRCGGHVHAGAVGKVDEGARHKQRGEEQSEEATHRARRGCDGIQPALVQPTQGALSGEKEIKNM